VPGQLEVLCIGRFEAVQEIHYHPPQRNRRRCPLSLNAMQEENVLKSDIRVIKRKGLYYVAKSENGVKRFKPWLGDSFSFLYDFIMNNSIFPKKFGGHEQTL